MKSIKVTWEGIRPLIMVSDRLVDPKDPITKALKSLTKKRSKDVTDSDRDEIERLEFTGALYWDSEVGLYIPSDNIEATIKEGARKSKKGKAAEAACFVSEDRVPLILPNGKSFKSPDAMFKDPEYQFRRSVRVPPRTGARVMKIRPLIPTRWKIKFNLEYDESVLNESDLVTAMTDAGSLVGLCTWRPKFGRFLVECE
jgi:hypothetical protein